MQWPAEWAGLVVQSTAALRGTSTVWTVVEQAPGSDGTRVRQTNSMTGPARLFRLWRP
jgi:hypothetical protein